MPASHAKLARVDGQFCFIVAGALVLFAVFGVIAAQRAAKLRDAMRQFALDRRLALDTSKDHAAPYRVPMRLFREFHRGDDRLCYNQLGGAVRADDADHPIHGGVLQYETVSGSGKNRRKTTHRHSYLLVFMPEARAGIWVRPEGFFDRMAAAVGMNDLDFESVEFSDAFHVTAEDERFCYDLFHPPMIEMMLRRRPEGFRLQHGWFAIVASGARGPDWFGPNLDFAADFLAHWPRHLRATEAA